MSLLRRILMVRKAVGGGALQIRRDANIFSDYNLCSLENPSPIAVATSSFATLSIAEVRLFPSPSGIISTMAALENPVIVASVTSAYNLSQAS